MTPLVSVIIPSYNCEAYIAETINSVLSQDYPRIELLIIDDGSTDMTLEKIRHYGNKLKLIAQKNSGVCVARNRGIREATGEYICLMDHDDYWYPDKITRQIRAFINHPEVGVVYSEDTLWYPDANGVFPHPDTLKKIFADDEIDPVFSGWIYHLLLLEPCILTSTAMFRSEVFAKCGVFDELLPYSEDWDLWLRISRTYPLLKLRQSTTLYRQHFQQGSRKVRSIDYRSDLLANAEKMWGLSSPDGRSISQFEFRRQLANYRAVFGLQHLQANGIKTAVLALFKAWLTFPFNFKYLIYILAGIVGWKPKW